MTMMKRMPVLILLVASALLSCNDIISYKGNLAATGAIVSLATTSGTIGLQSGRFVYPFAVDAKTESIQVRSVLSDASNRMTVNGLPCSSGAWSQAIALPEGRMIPVTIVVSPNVSAPSDADVRTYTIEVSPAMEWGKPEAFFPEEIESQVYHTQVAGNAAGQMLVVWYQYMKSGMQLMMSERDKDGEWSLPVAIPRSIDNGHLVTIKMNKKGDAIIVWADEDDTEVRVIMKSNGAWPQGLKSKIVETCTTYLSIEGVDCAIDEYGNVVVVWSITNQGTIYERALIAGGADWSEKALVSQYASPLDARCPKVDLNKTGQGFFSWSQVDTLGYHIMARGYTMSSNILSDQAWPIDNEIGNTNPGIRVTSIGTGCIFWNDTQNRAFMTTSISSTGIPDGEKINLSGSTGCCFLGGTNPTFDANSFGIAIAAWGIKETTSGNAMFIVYGAVYDGHAWSEPVRLSDGSANESFHVRACINDQGRGGVVFFETDQYGSSCISAVEYNGSWSQKSILVQASNLFDIESLTIDGNGAMTCLWTRMPNSGSPMVYQSQYR